MTPQSKILVVEDQPIDMELVSDLLESAGFNVIKATNAERAILLARSARPDLVIMDKGLPGLNGLEATQILSSDPVTSHIPILALTAHALKGDEKTALEAGVLAYITKPINTRTFLDTVTAFLELGRPAPAPKPGAKP
jgi:CheY-like chemotaxis protein